MRARLCFTFLLACCISLCFAAAINLEGKWSGVVTLPNGNHFPISYLIHVDGNWITGEAQTEGTPRMIYDGKLDGSKISFNLSDDDGKDIKHSGTYFEQGDSISMNVLVQEMKFHVTLTRASVKK